MSGAQKRSFTLRWISAVTIGESLGFAVAAMVAVAVTVAGQALNAWVAYALLVAGGALEGVLLGLAQRWAAGRRSLVRRGLWRQASVLPWRGRSGCCPALSEWTCSIR